ncbi:sugar transporter [Sphingomonas bacterium]|uniref:sugar transporter n=1 Tax=Sphingomonas bacterium TaxID=1895847 RepID=UPI0015765B49|nr:sugar transporter [Sphingomonas bacterium]
MTRTPPPLWFRVAAVLLLLWALVGVASFAMDRAMTPAALARMSDYDRQLYASRPAWTILAYGIGTVAGLIGTIALVARRRDALGWFVVSLVGIALLFGWTLGATNLVAVKGVAAAALFPLVIALLCLLEIALARHAARRGWIG